MEWRIYPLDVLFFRGLEPMNAGETAVTRSLFPPSPEVMQGFVRTAVLQAMDVPFADYTAAAKGNGVSPRVREAVELVGSSADALGRLALRGPYIVRRRADTLDRWYPAPLDLRQLPPSTAWQSGRLGEPVESDLGAIPFVSSVAGTSAEGRWISAAGLGHYLAGRDVPDSEILPAEALYRGEPRIGIARDAATRTTREGLLFSPGFVRLEDREELGRVGLGLRVDGIPDDIQQACRGIQRLGGEGRLVAVFVGDEPAPLPAPEPGAEQRLLLLTPARFGGSWLPPGFRRQDSAWIGSIGGVDAAITSAVVGKPVRIGGWDMQERRPKAAEACLPPGSVFYVRGVDLGSLHDRTIGGRREAGFGHLLVGRS